MQFFEHWDDDDRMEALYSSSAVFDQTTMHSWAPAVHWAVRGLAYDTSGKELNKYKPSLILDQTTISQRFIRNGIVPIPVVIDFVFSEMVKSKEVMTIAEYEAMCERISTSKWLYRKTIGNTLSWGYQSLKQYVGSQSVDSTHLLSIIAIKNISDALYAYAISTLDPLDMVFCINQGEHRSCGMANPCSFQFMCRQFASNHPEWEFISRMDPSEFHWIAMYLDWSNRATTRGDILKIHDGKESHALHINAADESVFLLRHTMHSLESSISKLHERAQAAKSKAIQLKFAKRDREALTCFRQFKISQDSLNQRQVGLENLVITEHQLREMNAQSMIVAGYRVASKSMREVRQHLGLHIDDVQDAVSEWQSLVDESKQIDTLLASAGDVNTDFDESALEAELLALGELSAVPAATETPNLEQLLPEAPSTPPPFTAEVVKLEKSLESLSMSK